MENTRQYRKVGKLLATAAAALIALPIGYEIGDKVTQTIYDDTVFVSRQSGSSMVQTEYRDNFVDNKVRPSVAGGLAALTAVGAVALTRRAMKNK